MPLRDFRSVEYYRIKKDNSWDTQFILIPYEVPYEHCVDYIWGELSGMKLADNLQAVAVCNFPVTVTTTVTCQRCRLTKPVNQYGFNKKGQYKLICNSCVEYLSQLSSWNNRK